jgi:N-acetylneuraminic acid mutarotase
MGGICTLWNWKTKWQKEMIKTPPVDYLHFAQKWMSGSRRVLEKISKLTVGLVLLGMAWAFLPTFAYAQSNEWTWASGDRTQGAFSIYTTKGVPSSSAKPGARSGHMLWPDKSGNIWLFGGAGRDANGSTFGYLNDLWSYQPSTKLWTWVSGLSQLGASASAPGNYGTLGVPAPGNLPPGRISAETWTDASGNLWLFGGTLLDSAAGDMPINDFWEFNITSGLWVWMGGSSTPGQASVYGTRGAPSKNNIPGTCSNTDYWRTANWTDNQGRFWLFGCNGNDLWMFNPVSLEWTWVSGSNTGFHTGIYGTLGTPSANNVPGSRQLALGWSDRSGNIWIFGGLQSTPSGSQFSLNDLWEYQPSIDQWAWMGGSNTPLQNGYSGAYGLLQTPSITSAPGSRYGGLRWTDSVGNLWLYGGIGSDAAGAIGLLNDLWEFSPATGLWAWMGGDTLIRLDCDRGVIDSYCGQPGTYGASSVPALENMPGSRMATNNVTDASGNFWLFGGLGLDVFGTPGYLNDLWQFQPNTGSQKVVDTPVFTPGSGIYNGWTSVSIGDATPGASIEYMVNGQPPTVAYTGPITVASSQTITAIANASGYANSNVASASYDENLPVAAAPVFSVASGNYTAAQTVTITSGTAGAAIYYTIDGSQPTSASLLYNSPLTVATPRIIRAIAIADNYLNSAVASVTYNVASSQTVPQWTWVSGNGGNIGWYGTLRTPSVTNLPGWRVGAAGWTDSSGNLWLFGGQGFDAVGNEGYLNDLWKFDSADAQWTWMGGGDTIPNCSTQGSCGQPDVYGTMLSPGSSNIPSGRWRFVHWTDSNGNFWLFGGWGIDNHGTLGMLNDLWMFNPQTLQWTWMSGSSTLPGLFQGAPGIYGDVGTPSAVNTPGGRRYATGWADSSGHLWLQGGLGSDNLGIICDLDDFWKYDISLGQWSWKRGSQECSSVESENGVSPIYGTQGVPWIENDPGSRTESSAWSDGKGTAWLFGGENTDPGGVHFPMNDLWNYDPPSNIWTWVSTDAIGDGGGSGASVYGTLGVPAPANIPGPRGGLYSHWIDGDGNFWLLGGSSLASPNCPNSGGNVAYAGFLNDLWKFSPAIHEWTWMGGDGCPSEPDLFGTLGTPAVNNRPGSNASSGNNWTDKKGNLWLFGGDNNLLWQLGLHSAPVASAPHQANAPTFSLAAGSYTQVQTLTISDSSPGALIYFTTDGSQPSSKSSIYSVPITIASTQTITAIAIASNLTRSASTSAIYTIAQAATPVIAPAGGSFTIAQSVTITDTTAGANIYYTTDGTNPTTGSNQYSAPITVSKSEEIEAIAVGTGVAPSTLATAQFIINLQPSFEISGTNVTVARGAMTGNTSLITVTPSGGLTGNVTLTATMTSSPSGALNSPKLSFGATTPVNITGTNAGIATLTISTTPATNADLKPVTPSGRGLLAAGGAVFACVLIFGIPLRSRRWRALLGMAFLLFAFADGLIACGGSGGGQGGGGGGNSGTTPGNYTITVTGTSGALTETGTLTLTVN